VVKGKEGAIGGANADEDPAGENRKTEIDGQSGRTIESLLSGIGSD
jgi:hypothetical protein